MDPAKSLFTVRIRVLNALYCERHTKTKELLIPDNNQAIFKKRKPEKHGLNT